MMLSMDPEVFLASFTDETVEIALRGFRQKLSDYDLVFDRGNDSIVKRCGELYREYSIYPTKDHIAVKLLKLLFERALAEDAIIRDSNTCAISVQTLIDTCHCETPFEPQLLKLAWNVFGNQMGQAVRPNDDVTLLLAGPEVQYTSSYRERKLYDPEIAWKASRAVPWLRVAFASDTRIELPDTRGRAADHDQSRLFEHMAIEAIREAHRCWAYYTAQNLPEAVKRKVKDIDVYVYQVNLAPRHVWIGECKLRIEGNEGKLITGKEIRQLRHNLRVVRDYENNRPNESGDVHIHGYLISNAGGLDEDAHSIVAQAAEEEQLPITFVRAILTRHWSLDQRWTVTRWEPAFSEICGPQCA